MRNHKSTQDFPNRLLQHTSPAHPGFWRWSILIKCKCPSLRCIRGRVVQNKKTRRIRIKAIVIQAREKAGISFAQTDPVTLLVALQRGKAGNYFSKFLSWFFPVRNSGFLKDESLFIIIRTWYTLESCTSRVKFNPYPTTEFGINPKSNKTIIDSNPQKRFPLPWTELAFFNLEIRNEAKLMRTAKRHERLFDYEIKNAI